MSLTALIGLVNMITSIGLALFVFFRNPAGKTHRAYLLFGLSVGLYSVGYFLWGLAASAQEALFAFKILTTGIIAINSGYLEFVFNLLETREAKRRILWINHILNGLFIAAVWAEGLFGSVQRKNIWGYWPSPTPLFYVYFVVWILQMGYGLLAVRKGYLHAPNRQVTPLKYVFISTLIGYIGGGTNWLPWFEINFPPHLNFFVTVYVAILAYAILRYRLLDIEVIIKKTLVFAGIFGAIIGTVGVLTSLIQNYLGQFLGVGPMARQILSVLITILLFDPTRRILVNLTDKYLFQKKYDYHKLLKDASRGMSNIESLDRLLGLVVHFVTMKMRVKNAAVLMREGRSDQFHMVYQRGFEKRHLSLTLYTNDPLIHYLENHKEAVDIERVREQVESAPFRREKSAVAYDFEAIRERMIQLQASCCVPSFLGRELRAVLMLGEKKSGEYYSTEDLNLLYTLAQESSIAIENARLYDEAVKKSRELEHINEQLEDSKMLLTKALQEAEGANKQLQDTQAQLIHEQKMATLGRLAASVGHEVNNPLTILSMNVSRAILKYRKNPDMKVEEILDVFDKMEKNIERIKAVVNTLTGLLKKSEKGKFEPLSLKLILEETLPLVQFQTYLDNLTGTEVDFNVPGNVPLVRGDLERLQEVFLNLFINAYHAMAGKRHRKIAVLAEIDAKNPRMVAIHFRDNGSGMTEEVMQKIFNYGFTTKPPGKGSGLGLYMCKYIIELHGGDITVQSKVGEGTTFTLTLPIYEETQIPKTVSPRAATE